MIEVSDLLAEYEFLVIPTTLVLTRLKNKSSYSKYK